MSMFEFDQVRCGELWRAGVGRVSGEVREAEVKKKKGKRRFSLIIIGIIPFPQH
jgi:hypothetical protein